MVGTGGMSEAVFQPAHCMNVDTKAQEAGPVSPKLPDKCLPVLTIIINSGTLQSKAAWLTYMIELPQRKQLVQGHRARLRFELDSFVTSMDFSGTLTGGLNSSSCSLSQESLGWSIQTQ